MRGRVAASRANPTPSSDREHRLAGQQPADRDRRAGERAEHHHERSSPPPRQDPEQGGREHPRGEREPALGVEQRDDRRGQREGGAERRPGPVPLDPRAMARDYRGI
jgi:hypothetical protein